MFYNGLKFYLALDHAVPFSDKPSSSTTAARHNKEQSTGRKLAKDEHVAHKPGTNRKSNSTKDTTVQKASKNIADGNKARRK